MRRPISRLFARIGFIAVIHALTLTVATAFDHGETRFPLTGFHQFLECESCHMGGRFAGLPMDCSACHGGRLNLPALGKPANHIPSNNQCESCHNTQLWSMILKMDHSEVLGECHQCHNGVIADGKPADHLQTTELCSSCHTPNTWLLARFDHSTITDSCSSCHNGSTSTGKPLDHLQTTAECDNCHSTVAWLPATFDHSNITGNCSGCHNGSSATGKPGNHFVTNLDCNSCHSTVSWSNANYTHTSAAYPGEHRRSLDCIDCHLGNSQTNTWAFPAFQPDCAACHANDYRSDPHKKVDSPAVRYTVNELRDCTGSCHIYTNSSLTTIKEFRSGEHRIRDSSFSD